MPYLLGTDWHRRTLGPKHKHPALVLFDDTESIMFGAIGSQNSTPANTASYSEAPCALQYCDMRHLGARCNLKGIGLFSSSFLPCNVGRLGHWSEGLHRVSAQVGTVAAFNASASHRASELTVPTDT